MHKELDIEIYKHLENEMVTGEIYLGHLNYDFIFSKVNYIANCTEAIPFTPFDKVICQLLTIENQLSLEQIGEILGMNVYESSNPKRYLDVAEKEILMDALQSLTSGEFGKMIESGDINFSSCRLTPTGREYAKMKSKFKVTNNKPFDLYFDHTTGEHLKAKENFEFTKGKLIQNYYGVSIDFNDENFIKEIAASQIPDIYNIEKKNSFTDASIVSKQHYYKEYPIAITYDSNVRTFNAYCFDELNKNIKKSFSQWANRNIEIKNEILASLSSPKGVESDTKIESTFREAISHIEKNTPITHVKKDLLSKEVFDEFFFLNNFSDLVPHHAKYDLYICLTFCSQTIFEQIFQIIQKIENIESKIFIVFPENLKDDDDFRYESLLNMADESVTLFITKKNVKKSFFIIETDETANYYEVVIGEIENYSKSFFKKNEWDDRGAKIKDYIKTEFSNDYALIICDEINTSIQNDIEEDIVSIEQIEELDFYNEKLKVFKGFGSYEETIDDALQLLESFKTDSLERLEEQINDDFDDFEEALEAVFNEKEVFILKKKLEKIKINFFNYNQDLVNRFELIKLKIDNKIEEFEEAKRVYPFIIDTNIFINDPGIISKINKKHKIIIAAKVLDELDGFKTNPQLKETATKIIRSISSSTSNNIHRAKANLNLLPPDFNKRSPDNMILATALMYKDQKGYLVTEDKGLIEKAKTVEMKVLNYQEFANKFL
ncbi:PIN domain-containing protein [Flavobacterium sp.]|uniref:PIN domain-containing protein n=3 Tax=Flavobacterium sp. TaxID=239 RepID=UPI004047187E